MPWAFRQTLWTSLEEGLSPAGWLALWEAKGQPLPKQRPSILSRDLGAGPSTESVAMYPGCQHAWFSPGSCLAERSFQKSPRPLENPPTYGTSQMGWGCQTQQHWTCTGDQAGHPWQRGPTPKKTVLGRLICTQGPPLQEPPLPPQSRFELKLCFPSVLVSLSRSELEQG